MSEIKIGAAAPRTAAPQAVARTVAAGAEPVAVAPAPAVNFGGALLANGELRRLDGQVVGHDEQGRALLRTAIGNFLLAAPAGVALPLHSRLALQVTHIEMPLRALLLSRDGETLRPPPEVRLTASAPSPAPSPAAPAGAAALAPGAAIAALVVADGPIAGMLPAGTEIAFRLLGTMPAQAVTASSIAALQPTRLTAQPEAGLRLAAVPVGATASGEPLLRSALGLLSLQASPAPPPGMALLLEVLKPPETEPRAAPVRLPPDAQPLSWPALREAMRLLMPGADPTAFQTLFSRPLPLAGPRLTSGLLFLLAALSGGDGQSLLSADGLRRLVAAGHGELSRRLQAEFAAQGASAATTHDDWRMLPLFMLGDDQPIWLALFLRGRESEQDAQAAEGTRFLLHVELTHTGPLQIDGLLHAGRLDLMLRTHEPLADDLREGAKRTFDAVMAALDRPGRIEFQVRDRFPVSPQDRPAPPGRGAAVTV